MPTVTIAGGSGFIGQHLAATLTKHNFQVVILTRKEGTFCPFPTRTVNYQDPSSLITALKGTDYVVNLTGCLFSFTPEGYFQGNVLPTRALVQAANQTPTIKRFIQISSQAAAGPSANVPLTEQDPCHPVADYGRTKLAAENELSDLICPFVILRPPIVYGLHASGLTELDPFLKWGWFVDPTPNVQYSTIHVEDLTQSILLALTNQAVENQTFFVGDSVGCSWKQLIEATAQKPMRFINVPSWLAALSIRIYQLFAKPLKASALLNYDKINEMNIKGNWLCNSHAWTRLTGQTFRGLSNTSAKS